VSMEKNGFGRLLGQENLSEVYYGRNLKTGQTNSERAADGSDRLIDICHRTG